MQLARGTATVEYLYWLQESADLVGAGVGQCSRRAVADRSWVGRRLNRRLSTAAAPGVNVGSTRSEASMNDIDTPKRRLRIGGRGNDLS